VNHARLITIPFSHYCEKARWALDRCGIAYDEDGHLPIFHYRATRKAGGGRTVPVVTTPDGRVLSDSTDIIAWANSFKDGTLLPADAATRAEVLALEEDFDRNLGPATRRWGYGALLPVRAAQAMFTKNVPRWEAIALRATRPVAFGFLRRGLAITPDGIERSRKKICEVFARVADRLADGRRYLAGDRFTAADLTFAALATPIVVPPEHPRMQGASIDLLPAAARAEVMAWRESSPGRHALRMYADHRAQ
jgi:glutathione S-transferase